jgi:hypothetical protein
MLEAMYDFNPSEIDANSLKVLSDSIARLSSNQFDYIKYRQAIHSLKQMAMDETVAIQSTLTTAKTMGVSKQDIFQSAKNFSELLQKEELKFDDALQNQFAQKVTAKQEMLENLEALKVNLANQIKELEKKIANTGEESNRLIAEIKSNEEKIQNKKAEFKRTIETIREKIQSDFQTLQQ